MAKPAKISQRELRFHAGVGILWKKYGLKFAIVKLVVIGKKEAEKVLSMIDSFGQSVRSLIESTEQLHDGSWLWIRVLKVAEVNDVIRLLEVKRKPKGAK